MKTQYLFASLPTGLVKTNTLQFVGGVKDDSYYWDYCILDEGHQIKNPSTQMHKSCNRICRSMKTRRLLLTGTPIQNNLKELWALFDWATYGRLLRKFKK
jgi:SNF2 family DNA or RNA helicase